MYKEKRPTPTHACAEFPCPQSSPRVSSRPCSEAGGSPTHMRFSLLQPTEQFNGQGASFNGGSISYSQPGLSGVWSDGQAGGRPTRWMREERALRQEGVWRPSQAPLGLPPAHPWPDRTQRVLQEQAPLTSPPPLFVPCHSPLVPSLATPAPHCLGAPRHP